ncbi:CHAP domain-containing protein [Nonomuraea sp. NN258]|uniref:CHAP domain-containing protein n=1 Tax=Nonomuraea antri TaxID=2730852 RepID=UPI0015699E49|nr:CHAP domain-containing protein [Nonomuraea antri]NRQ35953.1 CHAP domain-containing protein [Nonomuraea antri]
MTTHLHHRTPGHLRRTRRTASRIAGVMLSVAVALGATAAVDLAAPQVAAANAAPSRGVIAATANSQVGTTATGDQCQKYGPLCADWCAMFATWVWEQAGVAGSPRSLYVATAIGQWGVERGLFKRRPASARGNPLPGDIAVYGEPGSGTGGHVSIVYTVNGDGTITTIDGNDGNRVTRKTINPITARAGRLNVPISGYVTPPGAVSVVSATAGVYRPANATFYLRDNNWAGAADITVQYGNIGDKPLVGDWDGNGTTTIGVYRPETRYFYLRNTNTPGDAQIGFHFGDPGDIPIAGDWDGDGDETVGVYRPSNSTFYLRNNNWAGPADRTIHFGNNNEDLPIVGDWDGDGDDSVSVYRPANATFYLVNSDVSTDNARVIQYGNHGDLPLTGNWNSDRYTTIGVYRPDTRYFYLRNDNTPGDAEIGFHFGNLDDVPIAGNWR